MKDHLKYDTPTVFHVINMDVIIQSGLDKVQQQSHIEHTKRRIEMETV